jgi:hypothetical protein
MFRDQRTAALLGLLDVVVASTIDDLSDRERLRLMRP